MRLAISGTLSRCVEVFDFVSLLSLGRINRVHAADPYGLSTGGERVTWILEGVIVPVETNGGEIQMHWDANPDARDIALSPKAKWIQKPGLKQLLANFKTVADELFAI